MARLRFPGRPGYRFDRQGVRYGADEVKNIKDPSLAIVAYIHQGLRQFRELFGESDEVMFTPLCLPGSKWPTAVNCDMAILIIFQIYY